jgi:tyrosine recombinase XerC
MPLRMAKSAEPAPKTSVSEGYLAYCRRVRNLSPHTVEAYRRDIARFEEFCAQNHITEEEVDEKTARSFIAELSREGKAKSSINRSISSLKRYYLYRMKYEGFPSNPFGEIKSMKNVRSLPDFLFESEIKDIVKLPGSDFWGRRDRAILELLYSTGCRISEVVSINVSDLSFKDRTIRVLGKGNKERFVFLGKAAVGALKEYLPAKNEYADQKDVDAHHALFVNYRGGRITQRGIFGIVQKYILRLGLAKHVSPHTFRHTFATHLINRGADIRTVQELLGHASLSTTQIYTHLGLTRLKRIYSEAHPHAKRKTYEKGLESDKK